MTHAERRKRREAIVDEYKAGATVPALAKKYGLGASTIHDLLVRLKVLRRKDPEDKLSAYAVLAELQNTNKTLDAIGRAGGITRQRVHQILTTARANGMKFPNRDRV